MTSEFRQAYRQLNAAQRQAVDTIDGPLLVVAGPGTGKTQLLSLRVANIMQQTDTAPGNILCLTFTDNAARNMRERLSTIIGQPAYHVAIHTFHSFGAELINQYADYFTDRQLLQQIDELGRYELLRGIFDDLPHGNPLSVKVNDQYVHLQDTLNVVSWLKQNGLLPDELRQIVQANQAFMHELAEQLAETFAATPSPKKLPAYRQLLRSVRRQASRQRLYGFPDYATECAAELATAIQDTPASGRYAPAMTAWRNRWCQKDAHGRHVFKDAGRNIRKLLAVVHVYEKLTHELSAQGLYDFDDMIIEAVHALERDPELRLNVQERYQYILVDEFQDTNKAQLRLLTALGDNPLYEQRPNIMAVGDDDQAIYAFQGAAVSNMVAFAGAYRQPAIITLTDNYRSSPAILDAGYAIAGQIGDRLESLLPAARKQLTARATYRDTALSHTAFASELAQYNWLAERIERYIADGVQPENIAVLAPRHRYLERLMPYLGQRQLPVAYERRENILESPLIRQLLTMAELTVAISEQRHDDVDALLAQVLSYDFWQLPSSVVIELSLDCYKRHVHWLDVTIKHPDKSLQRICQWFVELAQQSRLQPLEYLLDQLIGGTGDGIDSEFDDLRLLSQDRKHRFTSPLRQFYFNSGTYEHATDTYLTLLGQLSSLRQRLRQWKPVDTLFLKDLVTFAALHRTANLKIIDTNPHTQTTNAVQVMTAYKAKGLEFDVVFVINAQDEVWGPTARSRTPGISLPRNLPIAPASDGDNDKLRLLFVAMTRAKRHLHITGYTHSLDNRLSPELGFLTAITGLERQPVKRPTTKRAVEILTTDWAYRYRQVIADKATLFEPVLANYKLSVTHLNNFIDIVNSGPAYFFLHNLLRFPEAPTPSAAYGDAIHKSLQWAHNELRSRGALPATAQLLAYFEDVLRRKHLPPSDERTLTERGRAALQRYFEQRADRLKPGDLAERGFNNEGVVIAEARLSGKIDQLRFQAGGTARVVDYKTGKAAASWQGKDDFERIKLHKYRQQLLFYKLLVEHSASFSGKLTADSGALEFVEAPPGDDTLVPDLELVYEPAELQRFGRLIGAVWQHIMTLDFPDTAAYAANLHGIEQFEQDLIDGAI